MNDRVIGTLLVSLRFLVGGNGIKQVEAALIGMTEQAIKLDAAAQGAARKVTAFTGNLATALVADNTGAPYTEAMVTKANTMGQWRAVAGMTANVINRLTTFPVYLANQYAQTLGIDDKTLQAAGRGLGKFSSAYADMVKVIGFNAKQATAASDHFIRSFTSFSMMGNIMRDKISANLAIPLVRSLDTLRQRSLDMFPRIEKFITTVIKGLLWLSDIVTRVIYRVVQAVGKMTDI